MAKHLSSLTARLQTAASSGTLDAAARSVVVEAQAHSSKQILVALSGFMGGLMLMVALFVGYRFTDTRYRALRKLRNP